MHFRYCKLFFDIDNLNFQYRKFIYRYRKIPTFMDIEKLFFNIENYFSISMIRIFEINKY